MTADDTVDGAPQRIRPRPRTTQAAVPRRLPRPLPPDLLREASRRLGITSLLMAGLWTAVAVIPHLVSFSRPGVPPVFDPAVVDSLSAVIVVASLGLFVYTRRKEREPRSVLDVGLAYLVLTAFAIATIINWGPVPAHASVAPMISPIGPIMLMFAALVPNTPLKTLAAGLTAVSMNPISMLIARARGTWEFGPASTALLMHAPDYLLVPVAVAISHVVTALGEHVATAREMGSYQLGQLLGRGGMGEVYKATHRMLARPAAIKLIRPEMIRAGNDGGESAIKRFRREAEVVASLRSPHTVAPVIAHDETQPLATMAGLALGTPAYMAPEMALGRQVDGRADVYALGCVAYYLLSGQLVFDGATGLEVLLKRLNENPAPIADRSELPVPPELERVVMSCLARSPEDRPAAAELSRQLAALPIPPWTRDDARRWWTNWP